MEVIFNIINLKSLITFVHLAGLAFGLGGAWVLDGFLIKLSRKDVTPEKYQIIEFVSKFVLVGILLLWFSGLSFIAYYYLWAPENLANEKVWAKTFIVMVLSVNGYFVHTRILPKLKACIGRTLTESLSRSELKAMTAIGTVSFVSWLFPVILGVSKSLNFTVPALNIVAFYLVSMLAALVVANILSSKILFVSEPSQTSSQST
ncbi:hypothetical protein [Endozoicomonas arenosclerae]|uniref:hypothetical protein n=1 Tax=Endozoicomonas arenosclerae TaxID=1633495 RepID=UPI0007817DEC|nr:hypothetical protein [Endozoicomonas arenosclerae]